MIALKLLLARLWTRLNAVTITTTAALIPTYWTQARLDTIYYMVLTRSQYKKLVSPSSIQMQAVIMHVAVA